MNAHRIGLGAWLALILVQPLWYLWLAPPTGGSPWLALAFTVPPLLLPALALRRSTRRALLWAGVVALFYFAHGVTAAWAEPTARLPALLETAVTLIVICALGWDARSYRRAPKPQV